MVVAEEHRDEFVSVAEYLNDLASLDTEAGIKVWLVRVRAVRRAGDAVWSPEFVVQAEPNEWEAAVRRDTAPVFASLEDFYDKCSETSAQWASAAEVIISDWLGRDGTSEFHGNRNTVSLYLSSPRYPGGGTNVLQLFVSGHIAVCRGNIWQRSDAFHADKEQVELDAQIRQHFPNAHWPGKQMYIRVANPGTQAVNDFLDWLVGQFEIAMNR